MKRDEATRSFREQWTARTGDQSEFARSHTPFIREGWLLVRGLPVRLAETWLSGARFDSARTDQTLRYWLAVLPAPVYAMVAAFLPVPPMVNAVVIAGLAMICAGLAFRMGRKKQAETEPEIDAGAVDAALATSEKAMAALIDHLRSVEEEGKRGHDVTKDQAFGQWIQKFYVYAVRHGEERSIQAMKEELTDLLASMGITVYDEIILNEMGLPDLPDENYYIDEREGENFTRVKRPVVYSRNRLLAQGTLK